MRLFQIFSLTLAASGYLLSMFKCLEKLKVSSNVNSIIVQPKPFIPSLVFINIADQYFFVVKIPAVRIKLQKWTYYVSASFV